MTSAPRVTADARLGMVQAAIMVPQAATTGLGSVPPLSFAAALAGTTVNNDRPFPTPCLKGDALSIKICQEEYRRGVEDCRKVLRARLTLNKGDKPYTARDIISKIGKIWKTSAGWKMVPLGKGFYDFHFESTEDLKKIWAAGTVNIKPGLLRFSQWTKDFKLLTQKQTHVSLWIRLVELPQEYWRERTLKEIASAVGTPIDIDGPTRNRTFGHYARILVDIDLSKKAYDEILVEREDYAFKVEVQYERRPLFCHHCYSIGHNITTCRWLHPPAAKDKVDHGEQPVMEALRAPPTKPDGASTSAIGGSGPDTQTIQATPVKSVNHSTSVSSTEPVLTLTSNSFGFPLQNAFDSITPDDDLHLTRPVLDVVSPKAHDDVQPVEVRQSPQPSREVLENPVLTDATNSLLDGVEHNHVSHQELGMSPNGSTVRVTQAFHLGREDIRPMGEVQITQTSREEGEIPSADDVSEPLQDGVELGHVSPGELEKSPTGARESVSSPSHAAHDDVLAGAQDVRPHTDIASQVVGETLPTAVQQMVAPIQPPEFHPRENIQLGIDLWDRVREYDARAAAEGFMPVLTRNQKQKIKVQQVLAKSTKSRARGDNQTTDQ